MFLEIDVLQMLQTLEKQIAVMRSSAIAISDCVEHMRYSNMPIRMNAIISQNVYDIYRAVETYITCVHAIMGECSKDRSFAPRVELMLKADYRPRLCDPDDWGASLHAIGRHLDDGRLVLRASNTGVRHARELVFCLQTVIQEFDPDEIDWDLDSVKIRIKYIERRLAFLQEFFRALPPVQ